MIHSFHCVFLPNQFITIDEMIEKYKKVFGVEVSTEAVKETLRHYKSNKTDYSIDARRNAENKQWEYCLTIIQRPKASFYASPLMGAPKDATKLNSESQNQELPYLSNTKKEPVKHKMEVTDSEEFTEPAFSKTQPWQLRHVDLRHRGYALLKQTEREKAERVRTVIYPDGSESQIRVVSRFFMLKHILGLVKYLPHHQRRQRALEMLDLPWIWGIHWDPGGEE